MRAKLVQLLASLLIVSCGGCDPAEGLRCTGGNGSSGGGGSSTVDTFYYSPAEFEGWVSIFVLLSPNVNFPVDGFELGFGTVLPSGLSLDAVSGRIIGTPVVAGIVNCTIFARKVGGISMSATINFDIHENVAPSGLSYDPNPIVADQGSYILDSVPSFSGAPQVFSIDPALPSGLVIDSDTGVISGIQGGAAGSTQHLVTLSNPFGQTQAVVDVVSLPSLSGIEGLLVTSSIDQTLDSLAPDASQLNARDFAYFAGGSPVAVAPSRDGTRIYVATSHGRLYLVHRDLLSGALDTPTDLGSAANVKRLVVTPGDRYLVAVGGGQALRYTIQPDGSLLSSGQAAAPNSNASAICVGLQASFLAVGASSPGSLWIYDIEPTFALRGTQLTLGVDEVVTDLSSRSGTHLYATTSIYDFGTHTNHGHLRVFAVATPAQVAGGTSVLVQEQDIAIGGYLSSITALPNSSNLGDLLVTDSDLGRLYLGTINGSSNQLVVPLTTKNTTGFPYDSVLLDNGGSSPRLCILDPVDEVIRVHSLDTSSLALLGTIATRRQAIELLGIHGPHSRYVTDAAFVCGAIDADLRAFSGSAATGFVTSAQGPLLTSSAARDAIAHPFLPIVYTAERDAESLGVYSYAPATSSLAHLEDEVLGFGSQPISLALGLGGRSLFIADETGRVINADVDPTTGELSASGGGQVVSGSMVGARLCADPIGRFLYLVQPQAGRITTFRPFVNSGFPLMSAISMAVAQPVDIAASEDGRFMYVLDRASANVFAFSIDTADGGLVPTNGGFGVGAGSTRMALADWRTGSQIFVVDPTIDSCRELGRDRATGALSAGVAFGIASGVSAVAGFEFTAGEEGPLFAHESTAGATLEAYHGFNVPWSSHPVGHGPSAIATHGTYIVE